MYFEDFTPNQKFESRSKVVSEAQIDSFGTMIGDLNRLHFDDAYAIKAGFKHRVAHGLLTLSLSVGLWYSMDLTRESTIALLGLDGLTFKAPVYGGDEIRLVSEVTSCRESKSKEGAGIVTLRDAIVNQDGAEVATFERKLMIRKRPAPGQLG